MYFSTFQSIQTDYLLKDGNTRLVKKNNENP